MSPQVSSFTDAVAPISDVHNQIILALIGVLTAAVGALIYIVKNNAGMIQSASKEVTEINTAVNNVGPGDHRLYDMVMKISEKQEAFDKKWGNLPGDMDNAVTLAHTIHSLMEDHKYSQRQLDRIEKALSDHVVWEMNAKYNSSKHGEL